MRCLRAGLSVHMVLYKGHHLKNRMRHADDCLMQLGFREIFRLTYAIRVTQSSQWARCGQCFSCILRMTC